MIKIRKIIIEDAYRVAEIQVNAWHKAYAGIIPQPILERFNIKDRHKAWENIISHSEISETIVIENNQIVMGWAGYGKCRDKDKDPTSAQELFGIYIDPVSFRCGYGQQLWQQAKQEMLTQNPNEITLWVLKENCQAQAFYQKNGFKVDGTSKPLDSLGGTIESRMTLTIEK